MFLWRLLIFGYCNATFSLCVLYVSIYSMSVLCGMYVVCAYICVCSCEYRYTWGVCIHVYSCMWMPESQSRILFYRVIPMIFWDSISRRYRSLPVPLQWPVAELIGSACLWITVLGFRHLSQCLDFHVGSGGSRAELQTLNSKPFTDWAISPTLKSLWIRMWPYSV